MPSHKAPCITYETSVDVSEMEEVKLEQEYNNGTTKKKICPVFTGKSGIEGLLFVEKRFRTIARKLEYNTGEELFDNFEEVLADNAEEKWGNIADNIDAADRTPQRFDEAMKEFYLAYVTDSARDDMFEYLESDEVRKPRDVDSQSHANRIETLIRYANKLPGTDPPKNDNQMKKVVLHTYPELWQDNYSRSRKFAQDTLSDIMNYMANEKNIADKRDKSGKRKAISQEEETNNKRLQTKTSNDSHKSTQKDSSFDSPVNKNTCRHHGRHVWGDCYLNPKSKNYNYDATQRYYKRRDNTDNNDVGGPRGRNTYYQNPQYQHNNNVTTRNNQRPPQNSNNPNQQYHFDNSGDKYLSQRRQYLQNQLDSIDNHHYEYIGGGEQQNNMTDIRDSQWKW